MQKHTKNFFKHYGYDAGDTILCQVCTAIAIDLHHIIYRSRGGSDEADNLIALCRKCHDKAHKGTLSVETLKNLIT